MTTKAAPAPKETVLPAPARKPYAIEICETSAKAFQIASALIRQGYVMLKDRPVEVYTTGVASFTLVLGEPDQTGYADAAEAMKQALEIESAEFERRVAQEVQARIDQMKRDEHAARVAEAQAELKRKMKALEAEAAQIN